MNTSDGFVAKFSADGSPVYNTLVAGSSRDVATDLAIGAGGSVYVTGFTLSADFPTVSGAVQRTLGAATGGQAFVVKLSPNGEIQAATYFGGAARTSGSAIAIAATGDVFVTGTSSGDGFPVTGSNASTGNGFFLASFDPALSKVRQATVAYGGTVLTLDAQGNIYAAGAATGAGSNVPLQTSPGAFQSSVQPKVCYGSGIVFLPCAYQFVEKLDPTATKVLYATFLTGSSGATPAGIAVDAAGNATVAGTTNSADYPVTAEALQTVYSANAAPPPDLPGDRPGVNLPPAIGYVSRLNSSGTALIWSTFLGGSVQDAISSIAVDPNGNTYIAGQANSADFPGLSGSTPTGCAPSVNQGVGFVTRLGSDGASLSPTQLIYGVPVCTYASCFPNTQSTSSSALVIALRPDGKVAAAGANGAFGIVDMFSAERLACVTDPADNVQLTSVAPGQLLSIFGTRLALSIGATPPGNITTSFEGVSVTFNGVAAPILYASGEQVNVQVPYEIAGQRSVDMKVVSSGKALNEQKTLAVVQRQPSVFLSPDSLLSDLPGYSFCGSSFSRAQHALAVNSDGSLNTCLNGAAPGSTVTIFMNGSGQTDPAQLTGAISSGPAAPITPSASGPGIFSTTTLPGSISAVTQLSVEQTGTGQWELFPTVGGIPAREPIVIWIGR